MFGAMIGDIAGSIYEFDNIKTKNFTPLSPSCHFTDDTVMTFAVAEALRKSKEVGFVNLESLVVHEMQKFGRLYPGAGYGGSFGMWIHSSSPKPYNSFGNGAAMRVSPVAYFASSLEEVKELSGKVTAVTHNHAEGIKGAEATAVAIWMALNKFSKEEIRREMEKYYDLDFTYEGLNKNYVYDVTCQGTVPQAIFCFLVSTNFEDCLKTSVSIGGDTDTLCAISCAIAEAYYGIEKELHDQAVKFLDHGLLSLYKKYYKASTKIV